MVRESSILNDLDLAVKTLLGPLSGDTQLETALEYQAVFTAIDNHFDGYGLNPVVCTI